METRKMTRTEKEALIPIILEGLLFYLVTNGTIACAAAVFRCEIKAIALDTIGIV